MLRAVAASPRAHSFELAKREQGQAGAGQKPEPASHTLACRDIRVLHLPRTAAPIYPAQPTLRFLLVDKDEANTLFATERGAKLKAGKQQQLRQRARKQKQEERIAPRPSIPHLISRSTAPPCRPYVHIGAAGLPAPRRLSTDTRPPFIHPARSCANCLLLRHAQAQFVRRSSLLCLASELLALARG